MEAWAIDTIQKAFVDSLFEGKQTEHNRGVLKELLSHGGMTHYTLAKRVFGGKYSTAHDRVMALKSLGLIEKKGERPGTKNKQPSPLWGLTSLGYWVAAHEFDEGKVECRKLISQYWKAFTGIYHLDKVETDGPLYAQFTEWLESDVGMIDFLDTFGSSALTDRQTALVSFRRMVDYGLLALHSGRNYAFYVPYEMSVEGREPYAALGEIARDHRLFGKLHAVLRETDSPLYSEINKEAYEEVRRKLSTVSKSLATRLAETPLFTHQSVMDHADTLSHFVEKPLKQALAAARKELTERKSQKRFYFFPIYWIVIDAGRVCIITEDPGSLSSVWKDNCDLYVLHREDGKFIRVKKRQGQ